jgi:hypothetical protein
MDEKDYNKPHPGSGCQGIGETDPCKKIEPITESVPEDPSFVMSGSTF